MEPALYGRRSSTGSALMSARCTDVHCVACVSVVVHRMKGASVHDEGRAWSVAC